MKRIQDFFTIYKQSAWEKDAESMMQLYDDNAVIFDMWMQGYQKGLASWSLSIKEWLGSLGDEKVNAAFEMTEIHEDGNTGFASALVTYQAIATNNDIVRSMKNRITLGFIKKNDSWKVIHQHTSAPIDSNLDTILDFP